MSITQLFNLVKNKSFNIIKLETFITNHNIDLVFLKNYKNSNQENLLMHSIKYKNDLTFFKHLFIMGFDLGKNCYKMTPIDICVYYNKSNTHQKLLILDWLYSKNIEFNPFYLLLYPRNIIEWILNKYWTIDVNKKDDLGNTALHEICKIHHFYKFKSNIINNSYDAFYILLKLGGDPYILNKYGNSAIDYCIKNSLINNLNILYKFNFHLNKKQINNLINNQNYYKLLKNSNWLIKNYDKLNLLYKKDDFTNLMLDKIIHIQKKVTNYSNTKNDIENNFNKIIFYDDLFDMYFFDIENNIFIE